MSLTEKTIVVGITGGIAAYKTCEIVRSLVKLNATVKVVLTENAKEFVTKTTLQTLSKNPVYCEQYNTEDWKPDHINLADSADLFLIAPASANTIGKVANGICDNLLTSLLCAFNKTALYAPAMNVNMWNNKFVQENIEKLKQNGAIFVEPTEGELACGYEGKGRMAEPQDIVAKVVEILGRKPFLKGKKILITAGGTKENIDPVRYVGNYSSGKMGLAIADAAFALGAEVVLVHTICELSRKYKTIQVTSAQEMLETTEKAFISSDALIMTAAVADYRPEKVLENKLKKETADNFQINMVKNPDILAEMSKIKTYNQLVIGFCAESENLIEYAERKINKKNLDFIVANDISQKDIGFNSDYNTVTVIDSAKNKTVFEKQLKTELAYKILEVIFDDKN